MPRVAGVDPGTVSFDLCVLQDGEPVLEQVFAAGSLGENSGPLLQALVRHGPYDLVYGPSGYGLPLVAAADVDERALAEMVLVRPDETHADAGVGGLRSLLRALVDSGLPVIFGPGVIHLASVPPHRKYNRIDMGTADKVSAAAYAIADQSARLGIAPDRSAMVLLELGGAFTAALAIDSGQVVDGMGGSSGPLGVRAAGALDGEVAYLLAAVLRKDTLYSGGALDPGGTLASADLEALWASADLADGWTALLEAAAKAVRALLGQRAGPARDRRLRPAGPPARARRGARRFVGGPRPGGRARSRPGQRGRARRRAPGRCPGGRPARRLGEDAEAAGVPRHGARPSAGRRRRHHHAGVSGRRMTGLPDRAVNRD